MPWQQHRHWLTPIDGDRLPGQSHLVRNERTGEWFRWHRTPGDAGEARFMVPTRYALIANRRWDDDPWSYCLVLQPQPPFRFSKGGFETSAQAEPAPIDAEIPATITTSVTARDAATVLIVVELRDERGERARQWTFDGQGFHKGQTRSYAVTWRPSPEAAPGLYLIEIGVFSLEWGRLLHWNDGTGVLLLRDSEPAGEP
jgi:hypothetical protein